MGNITLSGQKDGQPTLTYSVSISDTDMDRLMYAQGAILFPRGVLVPAHDDVPDSYRAPTVEEVFNALCQFVVDNINLRTTEYYRAQAAASIQPLDVEKVTL